MTTEGSHDDALGLDLAAGSRFGNYEIVRKLGAGGMGAVYEARRQGLNKRVALKVLTLGGNPSVTARFVQEARISASLEHPHVADCFDVGDVDGVPFLALEFLDGETLGARLERGPFGATEIADIMVPVCSALYAAHEKGVVHRDLKPDNIFLARQVGATVPKVLDFGIAKAQPGSESQGITRTASIMGTPGYMSPEQARDSKNVGPPTDQFALGVMLWEALTGHVLFEGDSAIEVLMKVIREPAPPLRSRCPALDPAFEAVVERLLEKDPSDRFVSMREVGASLLPFASPELRTRWASEFGEVTAAPPTPLDAPAPAHAPPTDHATMLDTRATGSSPSIALSGATRAKLFASELPRRAWLVAAVITLLLVATIIGWRAARSNAPPTEDAGALAALPVRPESTSLTTTSEPTTPTSDAAVAPGAQSTHPASPAQHPRPRAHRGVPAFLRRVIPSLGGHRPRPR